MKTKKFKKGLKTGRICNIIITVNRMITDVALFAYDMQVNYANVETHKKVSRRLAYAGVDVSAYEAPRRTYCASK